MTVKQLHAQIAVVSKALTELELIYPLESRLTESKVRLHGARPIGQQTDELRGVISRCQKLLAGAEFAKVEVEVSIIKETGDIASQQTQLAELEPLLARVTRKHSIINRHTRAGKQQYRQRCNCVIPSRSAGPSTSVYPTRCAAEWNTGQYHQHVRCVESREQARRQRRLVTEHEQSATRNEDDDGRDAATRGRQGSSAGNVVRLMTAATNVSSVSSGGGAAKAHIADTGGLNITGRMTERSYLFFEAYLDIIGVQESRSPQTQILQTKDYTVFNSGASSDKYHCDVQLWIKELHAKVVKSTEAANSRLLVAKIVTRASLHDRSARILHVFVLHASCEVVASHDSDAFYMQVRERMNVIPRGQLCLLLGDFNARVGSITADCFGRHAPVTDI